MKKRVAMGVAATLAVTGAAVLVQASPASAVSMSGCAYPRVCFYKYSADYWNNSPTAACQDVTSYWQILGPNSYGADYIMNTRNDDVASLPSTNGDVMCLGPNGLAYEPYRVVDEIRISYSSTC